MEFSEEWKSYFPIGKSLNPPLLLSSTSFGPLFFIPKPKTLPKILFTSPSIFPPILPPIPRLSFSRFLSTSSIPQASSSSIATDFASSQNDDVSSLLSHNRLHLLHCPDLNIALVFFTTGLNHDRIGFFGVHAQDDDFRFLGDCKGDVFMSHDHSNNRILKILVNSVDDDDDDSVVGYLMACTLYCVYWYSVKFFSSSKKPCLGYLGCKLFRSSSVVCACFSRHLAHESMVLLENGSLYLFDLEADVNGQIPDARFKGRKLRVSWDDFSGSKSCKWIGVEFIWHPRILTVARSDAVFLVDFRLEQCNLVCLANVEMLSPYTVAEEDQFLAFSRAGDDGFQFVLASYSLLVLCDVRKPMMPLLCWAHSLHTPRYIDVVRLSELRSQPRNDKYQWATESGFCIMLGSFWNCEFRLFCYGSSLASEEPIAKENLKLCNPFLAWNLPSDLVLSGEECNCASCLVREEFSKDALPEWIDWQQKKDIVLGFGILNKDLTELVCGADEFGGFTLIRLMSSGKIEAQRYCASFNLLPKLDVAHKQTLLNFEDSLLYDLGDDEYDFPKRFQYLNLEYLRAYLNGNLAEMLDSKMKSHVGSLKKESFSLDIHENLCEKLKVCGFGRCRSGPPLAIVLNDISSPTSICEVASRELWATLPLELLLLAFTNYSELLDVPFDVDTLPLEFSVVPELSQLPPYLLRKPSFRSTKWSNKVQRDDSPVGPVLPLPILLTLHEIRNGHPDSQKMLEFSSDAELGFQCNEVMRSIKEMAVKDSSLDDDGEAISLAEDRDEMWVDSQRSKPFFLYHQVGGDSSSTFQLQEKNIHEDEKFTTMITKVHENKADPSDRLDNVGMELFDDLCPIELKFDVPVMSFGSRELEAYKILKRQFSKWQEHFKPYQELCMEKKFNFKKG